MRCLRFCVNPQSWKIHDIQFNNRAWTSLLSILFVFLSIGRLLGATGNLVAVTLAVIGSGCGLATTTAYFRRGDRYVVSTGAPQRLSWVAQGGLFAIDVVFVCIRTVWLAFEVSVCVVGVVVDWMLTAVSGTHRRKINIMICTVALQQLVLALSLGLFLRFARGWKNSLLIRVDIMLR